MGKRVSSFRSIRLWSFYLVQSQSRIHQLHPRSAASKPDSELNKCFHSSESWNYFTTDSVTQRRTEQIHQIMWIRATEEFVEASSLMITLPGYVLIYCECFRLSTKLHLIVFSWSFRFMPSLLQDKTSVFTFTQQLVNRRRRKSLSFWASTVSHESETDVLDCFSLKTEKSEFVAAAQINKDKTF